MKDKLSDKAILHSELPKEFFEQEANFINRPKFSKSPDYEEESAIPWPKIEGSLPIQSPTSKSPRDFNRSRSKSVFQPHIVEYRRR